MDQDTTGYNNIAKEFESLRGGFSAGNAASQSTPLAAMGQSSTTQARPAEKAIGSVMSGVDRSEYDPMKAAAEDAVVSKSFRDDLLFARMNAPAPKQDASPGVLPHTSYYPNANDPIIKGYMSGKVIGSQPLFAASGGLMPVGMLDARRKVVADAGKRQAERAAAKAREFKKVEAYKPVENSINDSWMNSVSQLEEKYIKKYGSSAIEMMNDPNSSFSTEFAKVDQAHRTLGEYTVLVEDTINKKLEDIVDGKQTATETTRNALNSYREGMTEAMSKIHGNMTPDDMDAVSDQLGVYMSAALPAINMMGVYDKYFNGNITRDLKEYSPQLSAILERKSKGETLSTDDMNIITQASKKYMDDGRLDTFVDQIWSAHSYDIKLANPFEKDEEKLKAQVKEEIEARFGVENELKVTTSKKEAGMSGGGWAVGGKDYALQPTSISNVAKEQMYLSQGASAGQAYSVVPRKGGTKTRTIEIDGYASFPELAKDKQQFVGNTGVDLHAMYIVEGTFPDAQGKMQSGYFLTGMTDQTPVSKTSGSTTGRLKKADSGKQQVVRIPLSLKNGGTFGGTRALDSFIEQYGLNKDEMYGLVKANHDAANF